MRRSTSLVAVCSASASAVSWRCFAAVTAFKAWTAKDWSRSTSSSVNGSTMCLNTAIPSGGPPVGSGTYTADFSPSRTAASLDWAYWSPSVDWSSKRNTRRSRSTSTNAEVSALSR